MAENIIIRKEDAVESGALESIKELANGLENILRIKKDIASTASFKDSSDLKNFAKDQAEGLKIEAALIKLKEAEERVNTQVVKTLEAEAKARKAENSEIEQSIKLSEKRKKQAEQEAGAYSKLSKELNDNRKAAKDLLAQNRELSSEEQKIIDKTIELDARLKKVDETLGQSQRNVGNYKSGFNGLQNSVNQLTRELPAFTFSAQTGFLAISNNLPILADELGKIKRSNAELLAQGKEGQSVFKAFAGALFSWGTALSIGVTLLTFFGKDVIDFFQEILTGSSEAIKKQNEYNESLKETARIAKNNLKEAEYDLKAAYGDISEFENRRSKLFDKSDEDTLKRQEKLTKDLRDLSIKEAEAQDAFNKKVGALTIDVDKETVDKRKAEIAEFNRQRKLLEEAGFDDFKSIKLKESADLKKINDDEVKEETEKNRKIREENERAEKERVASRKKDLDFFKEVQEIFAAAPFVRKKQREQEEKEREEENRKREKEAEELIKRIDEHAEEIRKKREEEKQDRIKRDQEIISDAKTITDVLNQELNKRNSRETENINFEIDAKKRAVDQQQELANKGLSNQLAFEKAAQTKLELQRKESLERQRKQDEEIKLAQLFLSNLNQKIGAGEDYATATFHAIEETIGSKIIAKTIAGFADGGYTGDGDKYDPAGIVHKGEFVTTKEDTALYRPLLESIHKGTYESEYLPKYAMETGLNLSTGSNMANSIMLRQMAKMNQYLPYLEQIANKPETSVRLDNLGNVIEETNYRGMKTVVNHITKKKNWI